LRQISEACQLTGTYYSASASTGPAPIRTLSYCLVFRFSTRRSLYSLFSMPLTTLTMTPTDIQIPTTTIKQRRRKSTCCHHPSTIASDLASSPSALTLASLRQLVLSHLAELEDWLSHKQLEFSDLSIDVLKSRGEITVEDAQAWARTSLDMLRSLRSDVCSHLPDLDLDFTVGNIVHHLSDVNSVPDMMNDVRSHLHDIQIPNFCSHLTKIHLSDEDQSRIDLVRSRFGDLKFPAPLDYIPTLTEHLEFLHAHLSSQIPAGINYLSTPGLTLWHDILDRLLSSDWYLNLKSSEKAVENMFGRATLGVKDAVQRSLNGSRLIHYADLPLEWRNNPFVHRGYR
jgi:adiponectin receptor